jgi:L-fucose isomerase-like protein
MDKPSQSSRYLSGLPLRTRRHFETVAIINQLEHAERYATIEQFTAAARIAARAICNAKLGRLARRSTKPGR